MDVGTGVVALIEKNTYVEIAYAGFECDNWIVRHRKIKISD